MAESSEPVADEVTTMNEETQVSPYDESQAANSLSSSQFARSFDHGQTDVSIKIPSFNLHEGSFDRPHFGPQTNTQHVEANQIEYANITHHHTHYHKERQGSETEGHSEQTNTGGKKQRRRKSSKTDDLKGYVKLSDDMYMDTEEPLKVGTQVFNGYLKHVSGQKQPIVVKKIVPCDEKSIREVHHLVNLSPHPNVVRILRSKKHRSLTHFELYIAMELCKLQNLQDYLTENRKNNKPFDFTQTMSYAKQLINGMKHIHANRIIHKDLKPENILFSLDGTQIKVSDFGISKQLQGNRTKTKLTSQGTDGFRAPETFHSDTISMKSDIYSLAVTLYSMFANGTHPYGEDSHLQIYNMKQNNGLDLSGLPDEMGEMMKDLFIDLLIKMLEFDPSKRPTIEEVANHLFFTKYSSEAKQQLADEVEEDNCYLLDELEAGVESDEESISDDAVEQLPLELEERIVVGRKLQARRLTIRADLPSEGRETPNSRLCSFCALLVAVLAIAAGIHYRMNQTRGMNHAEGGTLHLRSKFLHDGLDGPHLQADFSHADGEPPPESTFRIKQNLMMRKELQKLANKRNFKKWIVSIYFTNPDFETRLTMKDFHQGFRICHKCVPLKDLEPNSFNISMTYDGDISTVELVDVVPLSQKCFDVAPEASWFGIIFWFDDETLELYAVNLGNLEVKYYWNLGNLDMISRRSLPLGLPVVILPIERYKVLLQKDAGGDTLVWTQISIELGGCTYSELKIFFHQFSER